MSPSDHRGGAAADTEGKTIRWARLYDLGTTILSLGRVSALRRKMVELAAIAPGERILDVGCGPGRLTILAGTVAGPSSEACGIDPAPEMVDLARRNAERAGVEVRFQVGAIEALPYPDDCFDVVLSSRTGWDHAEHLRQLRREQGFGTVEMGPTGHRGLALVRGRKPAGQT